MRLKISSSYLPSLLFLNSGVPKAEHTGQAQEQTQPALRFEAWGKGKLVSNPSVGWAKRKESSKV